MSTNISTSPFTTYLYSFYSTTANWSVLDQFAATIVHIFIFLTPLSVLVLFAERKITADAQMRLGPNRVGPFGIAQSITDALKLFFKGDLPEPGGSSALFKYGPIVALSAIYCAYAAVPTASDFALSEHDWSLYSIIIAMVFSQAVLFYAGYASGGHRSVVASFKVFAHLAAYLAPLLFAGISVVLITGSANVQKIIQMQAGGPWNWFIFNYPTTVFSAIPLWFALFIWQAKAPFDAPFSTTDLAKGLLAQYSGVRAGFFSILRASQLVLTSAVVVSLFFGGYNFPWSLESFGRAKNIVEYGVYLIKIALVMYLNMWVSLSLPKVRIDQTIRMSWKFLLPVAIIGLLLTTVWLVMFKGRGLWQLLQQ